MFRVETYNHSAAKILLSMVDSTALLNQLSSKPLRHIIASTADTKHISIVKGITTANSNNSIKASKLMNPQIPKANKKEIVA